MNNGDFFQMSGTSQAAAVVSGVAALVLGQNPGLTPDQVKCRIMASGQPAVDADGQARLQRVAAGHRPRRRQGRGHTARRPTAPTRASTSPPISPARSTTWAACASWRTAPSQVGNPNGKLWDQASTGTRDTRGTRATCGRRASSGPQGYAVGQASLGTEFTAQHTPATSPGSAAIRARSARSWQHLGACPSTPGSRQNKVSKSSRGCAPGPLTRPGGFLSRRPGMNRPAGSTGLRSLTFAVAADVMQIAAVPARRLHLEARAHSTRAFAPPVLFGTRHRPGARDRTAQMLDEGRRRSQPRERLGTSLSNARLCLLAYKACARGCGVTTARRRSYAVRRT